MVGSPAQICSTGGLGRKSSAKGCGRLVAEGGVSQHSTCMHDALELGQVPWGCCSQCCSFLDAAGVCLVGSDLRLAERVAGICQGTCCVHAELASAASEVYVLHKLLTQPTCHCCSQTAQPTCNNSSSVISILVDGGNSGTIRVMNFIMDNSNSDDDNYSDLHQSTDNPDL